jgi:hypothetical protein
VKTTDSNHPHAVAETHEKRVWKHHVKHVATNGSGKLQTNSQTVLKRFEP